MGRWCSGPFGGTRGDEAIPGDHRFLGATRDDTGLTLLGARYFDESTGAFLSVDPLLDLNDPAQWNAYAYANSNPVTLSDASGMLALGATDNTNIRGGSTTGGSSYMGKPATTTNVGVERPILSVGSQPRTQCSFVYRNPCPAGATPSPSPQPTPAAQAESPLPSIHGTLTVLGAVPVVGIGADAADAIICGFESDWACVGFSVLGFIPLVGDFFATALKLGRAGTHIADASAASTRIPEIKPGSSGGPTAGQRFPQSVRDEAFDENPGTCVYCHMDTEHPQVDHVIPRSRGGDATLDNAQVACAWCNGSKGARDFPVNPPPGYEGGWPPEWWDLY